MTNEPPIRNAGNPSQTDRPLTVLQVLPALVTGGVERGTVDMAAALSVAGHRALVASSGGHMVNEVQRAGGEHITLPLRSKNPLVMWRNIDQLARVIAAERVDVVHARSRAPAWSALYASRRTGCPFVTTVHGPYNGQNAVKRAYNSVMFRGDRVIATSDFIRQYLNESAPDLPEERIRVIPRGVDMAQFDIATVTHARMIQLSEAWSLPAGAPVILVPGRLVRWKGQRVMIEALSLLSDPEAVVVFAGGDVGHEAYKLELRRMAQHLGVESRVHFVGTCRDMPAAYALASVVASTSIEPEAFGRVAVESQAMGRPTVVTGIGGAMETVVPDETGWWVEPDNAADLARAVEVAIGLDQSERDALAARAVAHISANFTKTLMGQRTIDVYNEFVGA
ncbi:MAG: glycosyltransferase family 4 protein [Minwuia sp.]|nr:glycosyltransferase family 4 protein [Minwuia sp.]